VRLTEKLYEEALKTWPMGDRMVTWPMTSIRFGPNIWKTA